MSALVAKLKRNSFYGKMIEDLYRHEGTKFTREEERVVEKALKSLFYEINLCMYVNVPGWIKEIPNDLKTQEMCDEVVHIEPRSLEFVLDRFKTQEMCIEAVRREPYTLDHLPDHFKMQKMCNEAMSNNPTVLFLISDHFKTQEMCIKAVELDPCQPNDVPDHFTTKDMCDDAVWGDPFSLKFIPDQFVTQEQIKLWHDYDDYCDDSELIKWYDGYQKRKAQKAKIKKELLPIAWHLSRWQD